MSAPRIRLVGACPRGTSVPERIRANADGREVEAHVVGRTRRSTAEGVFPTDSETVPGPPVRCRGPVTARLSKVHLLPATDRSRPYRESGDQAVTERPRRHVDRTGSVGFALDVPTEGVRRVTAAGIRPGVGSVPLEDADAIARAALTVHPQYRSVSA
jgi:hypothetical protein